MIGRILGHYVVLEKIGAGGMGDVYRARDQHLERDVALKLLPSGFLGDEAARKRLRREALALSKLNHPNIATVFDLDTQGGVDFLAMELIHGAPLSDRLRAGALPDTEVFDLGIQLAEGLAAAHVEGVIHRDLKPGNLMITPHGGLKILDFGVAVVRQDSDLDLTRTAETESLSGTLPYMPPEQVRGEPADARSDIYSAGAVLYEAATGQRPFPQSQSAELIGAILHASPTRPAALRRQMMPALEAIVLKSLAKERAQRFQSARELLAALQAARSRAAHPQTRRLAVAVGAAVMLAVLLAGATISLDLGGLRERVFSLAPGLRAPAAVRRSIAVLGFRNVSGRVETAWLSTALSEMLTTELAAGEQLRTIAGENVSQMKINLSLADAETYGRDTLTKIRANLGTDVIVFGSYVPVSDGQIRLDVRLQDAVAGETLTAFSARGSETQLDDLAGRVGSALRQRLDVEELSAAEAVAVKAAFPANPQAVRLYTEGLGRLRVFDALTARPLLEAAIAIDPEYSLAHSALATAWSSAGYDERARAETRRAFELSANLSREDRLVVEARYRETNNEAERAIDIYRTLWNYFSDNLDYGLQLAGAQTAAAKGREALTTIEALRKLGSPASLDPRIDLAEALAAAAVSDFQRSQASSARAAERGEAIEARLLVARARNAEGSALFGLGDYQRAVSLHERAAEIYAAAGDRRGFTQALMSMGRVFILRSEYSSAEEVLKRALSTQREIGHQSGQAATLRALFVSRYLQKDLVAAKAFTEDALAIDRELNDRASLATGLNNLGIVLYDQGNRAARKAHEEALAIRREIGDRQGVAMSLNNLAQVVADQPDLAGARRLFEEALRIGQEIGNRSRVAYTLNALGAIIAQQGDRGQARARLEEAVAIRTELGEKGLAAEARVALAKVLIDDGEAARAETLAQEAAREFETQKVTTSQASALSALAESRLAQGKLAAAQGATDAALKLLRRDDVREMRLAIVTTAARVSASLGRTAEARKSLEAVLREAAEFQLARSELEARLAVGEIELKSGDTAAARARLTALEKDATATGFLNIARKARTVAAGT